MDRMRAADTVLDGQAGIGQANVTRGYGVLERFLARQRVAMANRLIPPEKRNGCILDVGCSEHPFFLLNTEFSERCGVDKTVVSSSIEQYRHQGIKLLHHDLEHFRELPYENNRFDVITLLAVLEHIERSQAPAVLAEVRRILKPGGVFLLTTPAVWADGLLRMLAAVHLVSPVEIQEHKAAYTPSRLVTVLTESGFERERISTGSFEAYLNLWATAHKE